MQAELLRGVSAQAEDKAQLAELAAQVELRRAEMNLPKINWHALPLPPGRADYAR